MIFQSPRCLIRPFVMDDIEAFMAYRNDDAWMRFQGFKGLNRQAYEDALLPQRAETEGVQLAIVDAANGALIGDLYLLRQADAMEIGYTVAPQFTRQGYAREAVQALLKVLPEHGVRRVRAAVMPENAASIALLRSLGFQQTGTDKFGDWVFHLSLNPSV